MVRAGSDTGQTIWNRTPRIKPPPDPTGKDEPMLRSRSHPLTFKERLAVERVRLEKRASSWTPGRSGMTFSRGPNKSTSMSGSIPRAACTRRDSGRWLETHQRNGPSAGCALRPSGLSVPLLDTAGRLWHPIASRAYFTPWRCSFLITCPKFLAFSTVFWPPKFRIFESGTGQTIKIQRR